MRTYGLQVWALAGVIAAGTVHGETLYERERDHSRGDGAGRIPGAAVCSVLAENHSPEVYKRLNANHGQPLHVWRLDFAVRNGSGRRLEHLAANFGISSEPPPCTSWSGPLGNYAKPVQWASSFQVLQKPDGMGLGEEVNDTVFVLAFHDQQPKFESWDVEYRFADEAGGEAEPARGAPAFIVVPVPAHATVSLLNTAQPYRRRMPLEPGRYQVEVSAPGYRTHRAWVDHEQTWPHRIELERLTGGDGSSTLSVPNSVPTAQLPPDVQVDLNLRKAEQALRDGDAATARAAMERLVRLQQEHGLEPEAEDHFRYAQAWEAAGEPERALEAAVRYLQLRGQQAQHYTEALDLMNRAESARAGLASEISEASRVVPRVPQRENSDVPARPESAIAGAATEESARVPQPETEATVQNPQLRMSEAESLKNPGPEIASGEERESGARAAGQTMIQAAKNENPDVLRALLQAGADIKAQDGNGATLLHYAARHNKNPQMVDLLVEAGLDVAETDEDGDTPLHWAAVNESPAMAKALLEAGANPNASDADDSTPLHSAAYSGSVEVFRTLLDAGADIEARSAGSWGLTVMHQAAGNDDPSMAEAVAELLIAAGVDPMEPSAEGGISPLHLAAQHNENPAAIKAFLSVGADVNARLDDSQRMPLHHAARWNNNPAVLEVLVAAGADIEAQDENGDTPLHFAAQHNENPAVIEVLLARGAELEAPNRFGFTPLHDAAWQNENPAITEALLAAGAKVAARNRSGLTPLHYAAKYNDNPDVVDALFGAWTDLKTLPAPDDYGGSALHLLARRASAAVIDALLKAGSDPEARNDNRETALHMAAVHNRDPAVIKALIAAGSDPNAQNEHGATPLHRAASSNDHPEVIEALLAAGADPNKLQIQPADGPFDSFEQAGTPLHVAAEYNGNPEVIKTLLRGGADPLARTERGRLPLHEALARNNLTVVEVLTAAVRTAGADPSARSEKYGATPLHYAAYNHKNPEVAEAILATGSSPMARDEDGDTPLHYAASLFGNLPVIDQLVAAGADVNARNEVGSAPLHVAAERPNSAVIDRLVAFGAEVNARDEVGFTPLHRAVSDFRLPLRDLKTAVETLIAAGADLNTTDQEGNSPLHSAAAVWTRYRSSYAESKPIELLLNGGADVQVRNAAGETPWDVVQASDDLDELKKQEIYWKFNDARLKAPARSAPAPPSRESARFRSAPDTGWACQIPGYPRPANPQGVGLSWCPAGVDFQVRVFALVAAGAQCAIAMGNSSTPEQVQARHREIEANCEQLAALGVRTGGGFTCACPPGYGGSGYAVDPGLVERDRELQAQRERQRAEAERAARREQQAEQEEARLAAQRERRRIAERNARILNSDCSCIAVSERNGEYTCMDDFVSDGTGKSLCDIRR